MIAYLILIVFGLYLLSFRVVHYLKRQMRQAILD